MRLEPEPEFSDDDPVGVPIATETQDVTPSTPGGLMRLEPEPEFPGEAGVPIATEAQDVAPSIPGGLMRLEPDPEFPGDDQADMPVVTEAQVDEPVDAAPFVDITNIRPSAVRLAGVTIAPTPSASPSTSPTPSRLNLTPRIHRKGLDDTIIPSSPTVPNARPKPRPAFKAALNERAVVEAAAAAAGAQAAIDAEIATRAENPAQAAADARAAIDAEVIAKAPADTQAAKVVAKVAADVPSGTDSPVLASGRRARKMTEFGERNAREIEEKRVKAAAKAAKAEAAKETTAARTGKKATRKGK
jgi:hypothetical protein